MLCSHKNHLVHTACVNWWILDQGTAMPLLFITSPRKVSFRKDRVVLEVAVVDQHHTREQQHHGRGCHRAHSTRLAMLQSKKKGHLSTLADLVRKRIRIAVLPALLKPHCARLCHFQTAPQVRLLQKSRRQGSGAHHSTSTGVVQTACSGCDLNQSQQVVV